MELNLSEYKAGIGTFLDVDWCAFCVKGAEVSIQIYQGHPQGIRFEVSGSLDTNYDLYWQKVISTKGWGDRDHATEYGAYGLAMILVELLTEYTTYDTMEKEHGFDLILKLKSDDSFPIDEDNFVQELLTVNGGGARLEVSGTQNRNAGNARLKQKVDQPHKSDAYFPSPSFAIVIDFETPRALTDIRNVNA